MPRIARRSLADAIALVGIVALPAQRAHAQLLETETARLLRRGWWKVGGAFETQSSADGREMAVPLLLEYGVSARLELLVEPVPYTEIRPSVGRHATGPGDIEATATFGLLTERGAAPALALAAEVKIPTANDVLIGTGRADYTTYLIASKRLGRLDTHYNVAYSIIGSPAGTSLNNIWSGAVAAVLPAGHRWQVFGEALGNTAAAPEAEGGDAPGETTPVPEAAGAEVVGTLGAGFLVVPSSLLYFGVSYDNNKAAQLRVGSTFYIRPRR
jgi:hypothetical protein